jgi:hypothetical protein
VVMKLICDFCSSLDIQWKYEAKSFSIQTDLTLWVSEGHWAACSACSELIESEKWQELTKRSVQTSEQLRVLAELLTADETNLVTESIQAFHQEFCKHRIGERVAL